MYYCETCGEYYCKKEMYWVDLAEMPVMCVYCQYDKEVKNEEFQKNQGE